MKSMVHPWWSWRTMLAIAVSVVAIGLGGWGASTSTPTEPVPTIASWLMIEAPWTPLDDEKPLNNNLDLASLRRTRTALVVCPTLLAEAVAQLRSQNPTIIEGKANPVAWLQAGIKVNELSDVLFTIAMPDGPREHQATIVNAVTDAYLQALNDWEAGRISTRIRESTAILTKHQADLREARGQLYRVPEVATETAATLRYEIARIEESTRRIKMALDRLHFESSQSPNVRLIARAIL